MISEFNRLRVDQGIEIQWGGLVFASRHLRGQMPQWGLEDTDWWDALGEDTDTIKAGRGVTLLIEHFPARTVTWSGLLEARSTKELLQQLQALQAARGTLLKVWEGPTGLWRQASCRRVSAQSTPVGAVAATYTVTVQMDDPLISSVDRVELNQSSDVTNVGSTRSYPRVTVDGPTAAGPKVTIGSWSITAPRALTDGEQMIVDTRTSTLWVGGSRVWPVMSAFPSLGAGSTTTISTDRGAGTVEGVSAWI